MKAFLITVLTGAALCAQTPPAAKTPTKTPAKTGTTGTKTGTPAAKTATPAAPRPNPLLNPAALRAVAPPVYRVKFATTKGDFIVEVTREWAPIGADRFYNLVRNRFFNDAAFFRVLPNFVVQFGMSANPAVSKAWETANLKDEPVKMGNKKGTIVFAQTSMPNTRSTQFFINLKDNSASLDSQNFSAFGTVTEGMEVVSALYAGYGERPDQDQIRLQGKAYLDKNFPQLDLIKSTTIIFPEPAAPATKAAPTGTKTGAPAGTKTGTTPAKTGTPAATPKKSTPPAAEKK